MTSDDITTTGTGVGAGAGSAAAAPRPGGLLRRLAGPPGPTRAPRGSTLLRHLAVAGVALVLLWYLTDHVQPFYDYQLAIIATYLCVVGGLTVLTGLNGQVSLGHSALMAVGAYTSALILHQFDQHNVTAQWRLFIAYPAAVLVTMVVGVIIGLAAARLRGPYLAGLTLAIVVVIPSITSHFDSIFHGDQGVSVATLVPPQAMANVPIQEWQSWVAVVAAALTMFLLANLVRSRFGRTMRVVRDNEIAAALVGVNVARTQVVTFVVSAACAGLGGAVFASLNNVAAPDAFALSLSLYLLLAIVLGGLGSLIGAVWGSIAIVALPYYTSTLLDNVSAAEAAKLRGNLPLAIFGLALIVIAIAVPGGIQGLLRRAGQAIRGGLRRGGSSAPNPPDAPQPARPADAPPPPEGGTGTPSPADPPDTTRPVAEPDASRPVAEPDATQPVAEPVAPHHPEVTT